MSPKLMEQVSMGLIVQIGFMIEEQNQVFFFKDTNVGMEIWAMKTIFHHSYSSIFSLVYIDCHSSIFSLV